MATITCEDCGHARHRCPSNTKYCIKCRLLRDVEFWAKKPRECADCEKTFTPLNRQDNYCGACQIGQTANRGSCVLCKTEQAYRVMPDVAVCERCARTPELRRKFVVGLRKGQDDRLANPPAAPPTPAYTQEVPEL